MKNTIIPILHHSNPISIAYNVKTQLKELQNILIICIKSDAPNARLKNYLHIRDVKYLHAQI